MLRTSHAESSLGFPALQVGSETWAELSCSDPWCQGTAAPAVLSPQAGWGWRPRSIKKAAFQCTQGNGTPSGGKQWERRNGDNQVLITAKPKHSYRVWETKYETNEELGNSFSLKTDSLVLLCWSWNDIFYFLPWWQIWGKEDALFTCSVYHAKENASLKDWSCGKTEEEIMDLPERGLSRHRATLQLQSFQELRWQESPTHQYTMYRLLQW